MNKRSQLCRYYGIFILLIISLVLVFSSFSIGEEPPDDGSLDTSKGQRYGKDSDIIPNLDGSGGVIIIQQGRNIYEEGNWKRLKDAKSLHNQNFGWAYINKDPDYEIETENSEYNYTHIKKLKLKTDLDGGIPFKIDNVQVLTVFNELEIENYYIGNIFAHNFTFGEHSTTIILQTADTKNLEDAHTFDSSNYGTATSMYFGVADTTLFRSYNKFNITQCDDCGIPSGQVILNANITFRIVTAFKEVGYKDLGAYHVYTQNWNEHSITRDNEPCGTNFDQSAECNLTVLNTINTNDLVASTIRGWNITPSFAQAYNDGDNNFTIAMKAVSESTGEGNYVTVATKEYATEQLHRPKLTVEYESPADTGFPYFTSHLNNQTYPYYNENINVSVNVIDDSDIDFIIFSTNDSGSWANHSFEPTATTSHFNYTILRVASSKDTLVGYAWFANDTGSNMNRTLNQSDDSYFFFRVQNTAPTITSAELNNTATVYTDTPVNCTIDFTDADAGDTLTRYSKFYSNDVLINGIWKDNTTILTTYAGLDKGDVLGCAGIVGDGTNNATSWIASTTNATILNSAPVMATAVINDTTPYTNEPVNCSVTATDEDADTFTFYYKWYDNYVTNNSIFESLPILDLSTSGWDKSNDVGCLALVNDGTTNSSWFVSTINATILNSVPIVATAVINDTTPYTNEPVNCSMTASDADIDTTTFYYRWYNDYATNGSIFTSPILDLSATGWDKTDKVGCVVISGDGTGNSTSFVSTTNATIQNTAPTHTTPILNATDHPLNKTTANLTGYDQGGSDADSDDIVFNYRWFKDDTLNATRFIDNSSLVLYLPFDYNHTFSDNITYDYRGENDGTVTDALFNSTGRLNGAYEFDGDGDYINVSDADFRFNTGDFSVAFWGKRTTTGEVQFMLDKRDGNLDGWAFLMEADNTVTASLDLVEVTSTNIMPNNKWIHIVAVYDRSDVITLYFNGASEATSASISGDNMDTTKSFVIGKPSYFSGANEFTGSIDEVIIFNRTLSSAEVSTIYNQTLYGEPRTINNCSLLLNIDDAGYEINQTYGSEVTHNTSNKDQYVIGNWWFEKNSTDMSGNGNDGTWYNADGDENVTGIVGYAYYFDGNDDYMKITHNANQNLNVSTILLWVKINQVSPGGEYALINKWSGAPNYAWGAELINTAGSMYPAIFYGGLTDPALDSSTALDMNTWYHLAFTYNGTNKIIYINGVFDKKDTSTGTVRIDATNLQIGRVSSTGYLNGTLDEVLIFNRSLSSAEISEIYNLTNDRVSFEGYNTTFTTTFAYDQHDTDWKIGCYDDLGIQWNSSQMYLELSSCPTHSTPILNSTYRTNYTYENLTVYNQSTADLDGDNVKNIIDWRLNNNSIAVLNMPMEAVNNGSEDKFTKDYSGNENHGVVNAIWNRTSGYDGFGAYEFDGQTTNISSTFSDTLFGDFSYSLWIKPKGFQSYDQIVIPYGYGRLEFTNNPYFMRVRINADGGGWSYTTTKVLTKDNWYHVVFTAKNNSQKLYVNSVLIVPVSTYAWSRLYTAGMPSIRVGGSGPQVFNGTIDEFLLFNRSLSAEQINALYHNETNRIVRQETKTYNNWTACITPNDGYCDGTEECSYSLYIIPSPLREIIKYTTDLFNSMIKYMGGMM